MIKLGIYQHTKGNFYQVLGIARHEVTLEELVIYQQLYAPYGLWARSLKVFTEVVEVNGEKKPRFTFIREALTQAPPFDER